MISGNSCYYFNIPSSIFQANLSRNALLVYIALASFTNRKDNKCYPSVSTLSKMIKLDRKYIYKAINELVNAGLLVIEKRRGRTNIYKLIPPKIENNAVEDKKEKKKRVSIPEAIKVELKRVTDELVSVIIKYLQEKGEEYVLSNIRYANKNAKENYVAYLLSALKKDWAKNIRAKQEEQNKYERAREEYKRFIGKVIVTKDERYIVEESSVYRENDNSAIPLGDILKNWDKWRPFLEKRAAEAAKSTGNSAQEKFSGKKVNLQEGLWELSSK